MVKEESRQSTFSLQDKVAPLPRNKKAAFVSSGSITNRTTPMPPPRRATSQQRFVFILYYFFSRFMFDFVKSPFFNRPHSFQLSHVFFQLFVSNILVNVSLFYFYSIILCCYIPQFYLVLWWWVVVPGFYLRWNLTDWDLVLVQLHVSKSSLYLSQLLMDAYLSSELSICLTETVYVFSSSPEINAIKRRFSSRTYCALTFAQLKQI